MKIVLLNGSPKSKGSASQVLLEEIGNRLGGAERILCNARKNQLHAEVIGHLAEADVLVMAFPLYVDGIPSHLLHCMEQLEQELVRARKKKLLVYPIVNCGFYEAHQNLLALEMVKHWCHRAGFIYRQGVAVGGGGMLPAIENTPPGHGPRKKISLALQNLADHILKNDEGETILVSPGIPRFAYKGAAERRWRQRAKENGLTKEDLSRRR